MQNQTTLGFVVKLNVFPINYYIIAIVLFQLIFFLSHNGSEVHFQEFCLCSLYWSGPHDPCYIVANINSLNKIEAFHLVSYCYLCSGLTSCMTLNLEN